MRGFVLGLMACTMLLPYAAAEGIDPVEIAARAACGVVPARSPVQFDALRQVPVEEDFFEALEWDLEEPKHWCRDNMEDVEGPFEIELP